MSNKTNDALVEELMENDNFIKLLEEKFLKTDGMAVNKDDFEKSFDAWLCRLTDHEILTFAETINLLEL